MVKNDLNFILVSLMISLQELSCHLDALLMPALFADFCFNGIQVEGKTQIKKIGTAVSASLATIEQAAFFGVDALIVHHGLFWNKDSYVIGGIKKEKIKILLEKEMSLIAYHLPLDAHREVGNNWRAALDMGWQDLSSFGAIGVKGTFPKISREKFQEKLENYYGHPAAIALGGSGEVCSAALISGGAYKSLADAANEGVDCFITGNFDEPAWHQAFEEKVNFFALGHSATETVGPKALAEHLKTYCKIECVFIDVPNPF